MVVKVKSKKLDLDNLPLEAWFISSKDRSRYPSQVSWAVTMNEGVPFRVTNPKAIKDFMTRAANKSFLTQISREEALKLLDNPEVFDPDFLDKREFADDQISSLQEKLDNITMSLDEKDKTIMSLKVQIDKSKEVIEKYQDMEQKFKKLEKLVNKTSKK